MAIGWLFEYLWSWSGSTLGYLYALKPSMNDVGLLQHHLLLEKLFLPLGVGSGAELKFLSI